MSEPTTPGGQQLLGTIPYGDYGERWFADAIAGVEAEARQQERERLAELVEAVDPFAITDAAGYRIDTAEAMRRAVLAILRADR